MAIHAHAAVLNLLPHTIRVLKGTDYNGVLFFLSSKREHFKI